jgi:micrococcal nuclease
MVVILTIPLYSLAAGSEHRRDNAVAGPVTARVLAVIDGDTLAVSARIWIGQTIETRVRPPGSTRRNFAATATASVNWPPPPAIS